MYLPFHASFTFQLCYTNGQNSKWRSQFLSYPLHYAKVILNIFDSAQPRQKGSPPKFTPCQFLSFDGSHLSRASMGFSIQSWGEKEAQLCHPSDTDFGPTSRAEKMLDRFSWGMFLWWGICFKETKSACEWKVVSDSFGFEIRISLEMSLWGCFREIVHLQDNCE